MTERKNVSAIQNVFSDAQQVSSDDLITEQQYVDHTFSALVQNHLGTGVIPASLDQPVLFDSTEIAGTLDGKPLLPQAQPSDSVSGTQLEVTLSGSSAAGRKSVKVAVVGLGFNNELQYDTFVFSKNEFQVTSKHYTQILSVLTNDLIGDTNRSFNLGGKVVVREAAALQISRDVVMVEQTSQPNLFFRDFFLDPAYLTLSSLLQAAAPGYNIDSLGVSTGFRQVRKLAVNDITTQLGQKFRATTDNIQKLTFLMSVENSSTPADLVWTGDLIISLYAIQTTVGAGDFVPNLAIDFSPQSQPLAQLSFNYTSLSNEGVVLDGYLQPVDFIFSNTPVANGIIKPGNYYAATIRRSGSANKCDIGMAVGTDRTSDSRVTIFNGTSWTDVPEEDFWYRIWTDAAKVSDGQAYDAGGGAVIDKVRTSTTTGVLEDYSVKNLSFFSTNQFFAHFKATDSFSTVVQDQRTGDDVFSRKQKEPQIALISNTALTELQAVSDPLILGSIQDKNVKTTDGVATTISSSFRHFGLFKNKAIVRLDEVSGSPTNNSDLVTQLLNGNLVNSKFTPNTSDPSKFYRIASANLHTLTWGDLNGDGVVDSEDLELANDLINDSLVTGPSSVDYVTNTNFFTTTNPVTFTITVGMSVVYSSTGSLVVDPVDGTVSSILDNTANFTGISNVLTGVLTITGSVAENNGVFDIIVVQSSTSLLIKKRYLDQDRIFRILSADLDESFAVESGDVSMISDFVSGVQPIPAVSLIARKIGSSFRVLVLTLESFSDRDDDYIQSVTTRAVSLHAAPDVFALDSAFALRDFSSSPVTFQITRRLSWLPDLVMTSSRPRLVPASFTDKDSGLPESPSSTIVSYPVYSEFDSGKNDLFVPDNLLLGKDLRKPNGELYKVDYEIGTVILNIPSINFTSDKVLNLFTDFVADYNQNGTTRLGYPAMKFADGTFVENPLGLSANQVRFSVALQSAYPELDGLSTDGYSGIIVDGKMGVHLSQETGQLTLNFSNIKNDLLLSTLSTKIQVTVFLKKAGFNNNFIVVDADKMAKLLSLS